MNMLGVPKYTVNMPLLNTYGYKPLKGGFGSLQIFSIGWMPGDCTLLSLDASHAILMCVLHFEVSTLRRRTLVRPVRVLLTGQTSTHRSDRSDPPVWSCSSTVFSSSVLALWINQETQWFSGEPMETPRTRCSLR
jgi:hypothetical protein